MFQAEETTLKAIVRHQNFTISKTKFYHIMSHCQALIRKSVVKFGFRCGKIWVLTRDH